ncbi:MAG: hypothetical protein ACLBM2_21205, partial [Dolichospermum sp.]
IDDLIDIVGKGCREVLLLGIFGSTIFTAGCLLEDVLKANIIRYYPSQVHLSRLMKNQEFPTCVGNFYLCSHD